MRCRGNTAQNNTLLLAPNWIQLVPTNYTLNLWKCCQFWIPHTHTHTHTRTRTHTQFSPNELLLPSVAYHNNPLTINLTSSLYNSLPYLLQHTFIVRTSGHDPRNYEVHVIQYFLFPLRITCSITTLSCSFSSSSPPPSSSPSSSPPPPPTAAPLLRRLVDLRPVRVRFVADAVVLGQVSFGYLAFPQSVSF